MRWLLLLAVTGGAVVLLAPVDASGGPRDRSCAARGPGAEAQNRQVRLYVKRVQGQWRLIACVRRTGVRRDLGSWGIQEFSDAAGIQDVWLRGRHVALQDGFTCDRYPGECYGRVRVVNVRTGRQKSGVSFQNVGANVGVLPQLGALLLKRNGSAAFAIARVGPQDDAGSPMDGPPSSEVWKLDGDGTARVDRSDGVDVASLAHNATTLYWLRDGTPQAVAFR